MDKKQTYSEKLRDPRWQKKRLEIMNRDEFTCQWCWDKETTLNVHHLKYEGKNPWETSDEYLLTICENCHTGEHRERKDAEEYLLYELKLHGFSVKDLYSLAMCEKSIKSIKEKQKKEWLDWINEFGRPHLKYK